jgi:hypothetical protein
MGRRVFLATFTAPNGTDLASYTPDIGSIGVAGQGTFYVQSNQAQGNTNADNDVFVWNAGVSDSVISCDVTGFFIGGLEADADMAFRYTDANNYWWWYWQWSNAGNHFSLVKKVAGSDTVVTMATAVGVSGTQYTVTIDCLGPVIKISLNGVLAITYTSATFNQNATKFGIRNGTNLTSSHPRWDNLSVTIPDAGIPLFTATLDTPASPWWPFPVPTFQAPPVPPAAPPAQKPSTFHPAIGINDPGMPWWPLPMPPVYVPPPRGGKPPDPVPTGPPQNVQLLLRLPDSDSKEFQARMRRFSELLSMFWNSLFRQGYMREVAHGQYVPLSGAIVKARVPTLTDDLSTGVNPGNIFVNSLTKTAYMNVDNTIGGAVWKQVT